MDDMAQSLQPKERVCSTGYMELSCRLCTKLSYRNATEMINLFQHRDAGETIKLRTLSDSVERVGEQISARLEGFIGSVRLILWYSYKISYFAY